MFDTLIAAIAKAFGTASLPYMIIGGQAVLLYGVPRLTKDVDITLGVDIGALESVTEAVAAAGLEILPKDFRSFVRETNVLPTRDPESGIRVDLIFSFTPYERQAIERAGSVSLLDTPVMFASVEDVIIHKIFAGRPRDLEDVRCILLKNPDTDLSYVRRWLAEFEGTNREKRFLRILEGLIRQTDAQR